MAETMTRADRGRSLKDWAGWHYVPGIAFLVVGVLALAEPPLASLAASFYVGVMLLVGGAFMLVGGIANISHRGGWIGGVLGLISVIAGWIVLRYPTAGAVSLVRVMGAWSVVGGLFEFAIGLSLPIGRAWLIFVSFVNVALGVFMVVMNPVAAFHFLGYFVGVSMVLQGLWSLVFTADLHGAGRR